MNVHQRLKAKKELVPLLSKTTEAFELLRTLAASEATVSPRRTRVVQGTRSNEEMLHVLFTDGHPGLAVKLDHSYEDRLYLQTTEFEVFCDQKWLNNQAYLVVRSLTHEPPRAFTLMLDDFISRSEILPGPLPPLLHTTIQEWKSLFDTLGATLLSDSQAIGLIAELHALSIIASEIGTDALSAWQFQGPRSAHDFSLQGNRSIEVKATAQRESFALAIHGFEQLTTDDQESLLLFAEQLEISPDGQTLPETIEQTRSALADPYNSDFEDKLLILGYRAEDAHRYTTRYKVLRSKASPVDNSFPRISRKYLPDHSHAELLKKVSYQVDFDTVFGAENDDSIALLKTFVRDDF